MKILNVIGIATLLFVALMLGSTESAGQDACEHGGNHVIQVRVGDDGTPVLKYRGESGEEVHVCQGDNVKWVLIGSNRDFSVDFFDGAPFGGAQRRGSENDEIDVDVGASVAKQTYEYDVAFGDDEPMDPRIIVE